jgi:hypothetical protein
VGVEPTTTSLQGISAVRCLSHGAEGWLRSNLPASSARCFHQISFLGELVGRDGVEPPQTMRGVYSALGSPMPSLPRLVAGARFERAFSGYEPDPGPGYRSDHPASKGLAESRELESHTVSRAIGFRSRAGAPVRLTLQAWRKATVSIRSGNCRKLGALRRSRTCNMPRLKRPPLPIGLPARTRGGHRTRTSRGLSPGPLPIGLRGRNWCTGRDSNPHCTPSEGVDSCRLVYRCMVPSPGFDPGASSIPTRCSAE